MDRERDIFDDDDSEEEDVFGDEDNYDSGISSDDDDEKQEHYIRCLMGDVVTEEMLGKACRQIKKGEDVYPQFSKEVHDKVDDFMSRMLAYNEKLETHLPEFYDRLKKTHDHMKDVNEEDNCIVEAYGVHKRRLHKMLEPHVRRYLHYCEEKN